MTVSGRNVLVTGAAQGIGAEIAGGLAARGAGVALADIADPGPVAREIAAATGTALAIVADVTEEDDCRRMVAETVDGLGGLDGLVCNAALFAGLPNTPFDDISVEDWDRVMAVNARGPWLCIRAAKPAMIEAGGGSIVLIASNRIFAGQSMLLHYDASKGAVLAMGRSLARELGPSDIRVNTIAPGLTMSEGTRGRDGIAEREAAVVRSRALGRSQMPADLVGACAFLLGSDSANVTGQTLVVDGGGVMH